MELTITLLHFILIPYIIVKSVKHKVLKMLSSVFLVYILTVGGSLLIFSFSSQNQRFFNKGHKYMFPKLKTSANNDMVSTACVIICNLLIG